MTGWVAAELAGAATIWLSVLVGLWWWALGRYQWQTAWLGGSQDRREDTHANDYHLALFRIAYKRGYNAIDRRQRQADATLRHLARRQRRIERRIARRNP